MMPHSCYFKTNWMHLFLQGLAALLSKQPQILRVRCLPITMQGMWLRTIPCAIPLTRTDGGDGRLCLWIAELDLSKGAIKHKSWRHLQSLLLISVSVPAGKGPVVPKFGSWDAENIGYTVFFEKVRENKTTPVPPTTEPRRHDDQEFDPYEYYENLSRNVPSRPPSSHGHAAPAQHYEHVGGNVPSRPPSSYGGHGHGHPAPAQHHYPAQHGGGGYHRRNGSNGSSAASEVSSRASKYSPPGPYQPRYTNNSGGGSYHQPQHQQQQYQGAAPGPRQYHPHTAPAPRVAASPPVNERRPGQGVPQARAAKAPSSAVPKFGVWDEQNANAAGQGYTVQFEKVKRHREVAKAAAPDVAPPKRQLSPDRAAPTWGYPRRKPKKSFLSKVYGCLFPVVRQ